MPSVNVNGNTADSVLSLQWDGITVVGTNGYLQNPRIQFYSRSGWSDTNNSIRSIGGAVANQLVRDASHGALNGGTRTWPLSATAIPLSVGSPTYSSFGARVTGISFFNGDANTNDYWTGDIQYPALPNPTPGPPVRYSGSLDYGAAMYIIDPGRQKARIWLPSNGRPIRVRAYTLFGSNVPISLEVWFPRVYYPDSGVPATHAQGTDAVEMTVYPGTHAVYLNVSRGNESTGQVIVVLSYL